MTPQMQAGIQKARADGVPEEMIQQKIRELQAQQPNQSPLPTTPPANTKSVGGFVSNVGRDIMDNVKGIASLPAVAVQAFKDPGGIAGALVEGTVNEYKDLITDPVNTAYDRPVSTALNVAPFVAGATKLASAGKLAKTADTVGDVSRAARVADTAGDAARIADEAAIARVLKDVGGVTDPNQASQLAKNLYQSSLSFSKKSNAFERLRPADTANAMIKYGIQGSSDDISRVASSVTGQDGILSRIVNESVGSVQKPLDTSRLSEYFTSIDDGYYSALDSKKIAEVQRRVARLPQGEKIGTVDASKLLDFERQLQKEATNHRLAGVKGDTAAIELADLKFGLADEIAKIIDEGVVDIKVLDRFNDPRIVAELEKISPQLAQEFQQAIVSGSVQQLRSLQSPFVRINQIIKLAEGEASSLGTNFFRQIAQIPGVGEVLNVISDQISTPLSTALAIGLEKQGLFKTAKNVAGASIKGKSGKIGSLVGGAAGSTLGGIPGAVAGGFAGGFAGQALSSPARVGGAALVGRQADDLGQPPATPPNLTQQGLPPDPSELMMDSPDEVVTITNDQTGETKQVKRSELGQYGLGEQQGNIPTQEMIREAIVNDFATNNGKNFEKLKKYQEYLYPEDEVDVGSIMLDEVEKMFFATDVPRDEFGASLTSWFRSLQASAGLDQNLRIYNDFKKPIALALAVRIQGSRPTDDDMKAAMALLPSEKDTETTAREKLDRARRLMQLPIAYQMSPEEESSYLE